MKISCNGANFVARQLNYSLTEGWGQGDSAAQAHFSPISTFAKRFSEQMQPLQKAGFKAVDIWTGTLHWAWAGDHHIADARKVLDDLGLEAVSYAGPFGDTEDEVRRATGVIGALGGRILGGFTGLLGSQNDLLAKILEEADQVFGLENHPETSVEEYLAKVEGLPAERIGLCPDTGWFGLNGINSAEALQVIRDRIFHIHLKDIRRPGVHDTCAFGQGIVPLKEVYQILVSTGYTGAVSIEHEPEDRDPMPEIIESLATLKSWMK